MITEQRQHRTTIRTTSIIAFWVVTLLVAQWLGTQNAAFAPIDRALARGGRPDQAVALRAAFEIWNHRWQLRPGARFKQIERRASDIGLTAIKICGSLEARPGVLAEAYAIATELEKRRPMEEPHNRKRLYEKGAKIKQLAERMINPQQFTERRR